MRVLNSIAKAGVSCVCAVFISSCATSFAQEWQEVKSEHFRVFFLKDKEFIDKLLYDAEEYYRKIASDLGYPRYSEFWTWEKRAKIYIYPDHATFVRASGQPQWSQGMADYGKKTILGFSLSDEFLDSVLPHEMAHLIFRDFVGFKGEVPLWLDEGVAQWEEVKKRDAAKQVMKRLYEQDALLSIQDMTRLDVRNITQQDRLIIRSTLTKTGEKGVLFLSSEGLVNTFYAQAASLVGFLITKYGSLDFAHFCRELRDGKKLEEALAAAYPAHIRSLDDFEKEWRRSIAEGQ